MKKPKLQIIVLFQNLGDSEAYYARSPAPPLTGLLVAGLTPPIVDVEVLHEMVRPIDYNTDAEFIALSFMDYCAPHAINVARRFRKLGKKVIAGGKYATTNPDDLAEHFDTVVVGEAERIWPQVVEDIVCGRLKCRYDAPFAPPLDNIPPPRYDLAEKIFKVPLVTEATRGCQYSCDFCHLTVKPTPYRVRPIGDVIADLKATDALPWMQRKLAMVYDNNLACDMDYAKALLREMAKLGLWAWGAQFSFDCLHDDEFVDLLAASNCRMAFIGMESLNDDSLAHVHKTHNRTEEYRELFTKLRRRGILVMAGCIFGLDGDTREYFESLPERLADVGPEVLLMSIAIPYPGTPLHARMKLENRIVNHDLSLYEGDHLVFRPLHLTQGEVVEAYRKNYEIFYRWRNVFKRAVRLLRAQNGWGLYPGSLVGTILSMGIYFRLAYFQRFHSRQKVMALGGCENQQAAQVCG